MSQPDATESPRCWVAATIPDAGPCEGRLIRAHLLSKQRIRKEFPHGAVFCVEIAQDGSIGAPAWRPFDPRLSYLAISDDPAARRVLDELLWDPRVYVWCCGGPFGNSGHHGKIDQHQLQIPRDALPVGVEEYATELGLGWELDRRYGFIEGRRCFLNDGGRDDPKMVAVDMVKDALATRAAYWQRATFVAAGDVHAR